MASVFVEHGRMFPATSHFLSWYASFSTIYMLLKNIYRDIVPEQVESWIISKLTSFFSIIFRRYSMSETVYATFLIDDESWLCSGTNKLVKAAEHYLPTKIGPNNTTIRLGRFDSENNVTTGLVEGEIIVDIFEGIEVEWKLVEQKNEHCHEKCFELRFEHKHWDKILDEYLPHILTSYKAFREGERILQLRNVDDRVDLRHPSTFDTLAMDSELKETIKDDLKRFLGRKDFYRRVGKAWKRGYLLYGPPGTGKSSLIAAMANYLMFDVYDLQLSDIYSDYDLRNTLLNIDSKTIIVVEDVDCHPVVLDRSKSDKSEKKAKTRSITLSALLNCIDGLWSSCGEERIIIFTTNHKDVLDPALLRPGRMDMRIEMSYCTPQGFRILASNYLGIKDHQLFKEIDELLPTVEATPASLAQELMISDDPDVSLGEVINFLKQTKIEKEKKQNESENEKESITTKEEDEEDSTDDEESTSYSESE